MIDMTRYRRHQDYDILAQVVTGEGLGDYVSMTDIETTGSSKNVESMSGFEATHLPFGLGYESDDVG